MSAEIQESLSNFKVVVVFNRLDYFRNKFDEANQENYKAAVKAGIASNILTPIYNVASNAAQIIVLAYGVSLIVQGTLTLGLLVGFLIYVNNFYTPLRQLASIWSSLQLALASLERISEVTSLTSTLELIPSKTPTLNAGVLTFKNVAFSYPESPELLHGVNFTLEK